MVFSIDHMIVTCVTTVIFVKAMFKKKSFLKGVHQHFPLERRKQQGWGGSSDGNSPSGSTTSATGRYIMCACLR